MKNTMLENLRNKADLKDLNRIVTSNKNYLVLQVSVFQGEASFIIILTNNNKKYKNCATSYGYSCIVPLENELISTIKDIINTKFTK